MATSHLHLHPANDSSPVNGNVRPSIVISYCQRDLRYIVEVIEIVERLGFSVAVDENGLRELEDTSDLVSSIQHCCAQIVMCTHASDESHLVQVATGYGRSKGKLQIPVMIDRINDLDFFLTHFRATPFIALWGLESGPIATAALAHELRRLLPMGQAAGAQNRFAG